MTESGWLRDDNAWEMLEFIRSSCGERKARLFSVWCCRHVWHLLTDSPSRLAVDVAERYADRLATQIDLKQTKRQAELVVETIERERESEFDLYLEGYSNWGGPERRRRLDAARAAANVARKGDALTVAQQIWSLVQSALENDSDVKSFRQNASDALRDIVGNPFREPCIESHSLRWHNCTVSKLALTIYEEQRFDLLPILSDALQEAGCTDRELLEHCFSKKPHVHGCWLIDLLLRKE